jgi:hypothetical protein
MLNRLLGYPHQVPPTRSVNGCGGKPATSRLSSESASELRYNWRSVSRSVSVSSPVWGSWPDIILFPESYCLVNMGRPLWREVGVCRLSQSVVSSKSFVSIYIIKYICKTYQSIIYVQYVHGLLSLQAQYSRLYPISSSFRYNGSLVTWTAVCLTAAKFEPLC